MVGKPRPKIRFDNTWISDGKIIYTRSLNASEKESGKSIKLPEGIERFSDFEIISDKEAILSGCFWQVDAETRAPVQNDIHVIFNYRTGMLTKIIESSDFSDIYKDTVTRTIFDMLFATESYMCSVEPYVLIVGKWSGIVTVIDTSNDKSSKYEIITKEEMPKDSKDAVNSGSAIAWVGPLAGNEVLFCYRMWVVPNGNPTKPVSVYCFRTLDLKSGKIKFEGSSYQGHTAEPHVTLIEEEGRLLAVRELINGSKK